MPPGIFNPHLPQNFEFSGNNVEHRGQGNVPVDSAGLTRINERPPHLPQNLIPSAKRALHVLHATIPGIMLE